MKTFFELKCRPWIFASGLLAFLNLGFVFACYSPSETTLSSAISADVSASAFFVLLWVGILRLFNPGPLRSGEISSSQCEGKKSVARERECCTV
jgi:hypothetical protein